MLVTLIYPKSRGTLRLASSDPMAAPLIDPNYFADPADKQLLIDGLRLVREIVKKDPVAGMVEQELQPTTRYQTDEELEEQVRLRATTVYHPVGTCKMGVDELAVTDPQLRVRGVEGLRVADASIMPTITGGNTNAPSIMIGERAAGWILGT